MPFKQSVFLFAFALILVTGCACAKRDHPGTPSADTTTDPGLESDATSPSVPPDSGTPRPWNDPLRGTVKETAESGGYTYVLLTVDRGEVWAAARKFAVAVGDEVELAGLQTMRDFHSPTLGRTFAEILFVDLAKVIGDGVTAGRGAARAPTPDLPVGHPPLGGEAPSHPKSKKSSEPIADRIAKLADGVTVAELFAKKADLVGKIVKFRGQVVKASRNILGSNWLHIQDGTGEAGTNDITVTSKKDFAAVGSIVVIQGTFGIDKDFGAGYSYDVIVEDATVLPDTGHQD